MTTPRPERPAALGPAFLAELERVCAELRALPKREPEPPDTTQQGQRK